MSSTFDILEAVEQAGAHPEGEVVAVRFGGGVPPGQPWGGATGRGECIFLPDGKIRLYWKIVPPDDHEHGGLWGGVRRASRAPFEYMGAYFVLDQLGRLVRELVGPRSWFWTTVDPRKSWAVVDRLSGRVSVEIRYGTWVTMRPAGMCPSERDGFHGRIESLFAGRTTALPLSRLPRTETWLLILAGGGVLGAAFIILLFWDEFYR